MKVTVNNPEVAITDFDDVKVGQAVTWGNKKQWFLRTHHGWLQLDTMTVQNNLYAGTGTKLTVADVECVLEVIQ